MSVALLGLALKGWRWAYVAFVVVAISYFPAHVGFRLVPLACEMTFSGQLALYSLRNFPHIVLFAAFYIASRVHFRSLGRRAWVWSAAMTLVMGTLVEVAEGVSGTGHCRVRDLIPDTAGLLLGAIAYALCAPLVMSGWALVLRRRAVTSRL